MPKPIVLGYATNKGLLMINEADAKRLTHVNLAFGLIENGLLTLRGLPDIAHIHEIRKWNPDIKFVLSVGGWTAGGFSPMAMTEEGRRAFAQSVAEAMDTHGLDGIDIDWEYPCNGSAGIEYDPRDRENFTLLMAALRDIAGDRIVSIAAGSGDYFVRDTEMEKVGEICDYVQLMTYDMRSGGCRQAGHHTGLFAAKGDAEDISTRACVERFARAGVPKDKLVIGAAFYSRIWGGVPDVNHGMLQQAETIANFGPGYTELVRDYIDKNGWVRYWDDDAKAPYLYNAEKGGFITYDDPESIRLKTEWLQQEGLHGIMYWEHSCDETHTLLQAMADAVK